MLTTLSDYTFLSSAPDMQNMLSTVTLSGYNMLFFDHVMDGYLSSHTELSGKSVYPMRSEDIAYLVDWAKFYNRFFNYGNIDISTNTSSFVEIKNVKRILPYANGVNFRGMPQAEILEGIKNSLTALYNTDGVKFLDISSDFDEISSRYDGLVLELSDSYLSGDGLQNVFPLSDEVASIPPLSDYLLSSDGWPLSVDDKMYWNSTWKYYLKPNKGYVRRLYDAYNQIRIVNYYNNNTTFNYVGNGWCMNHSTSWGDKRGLSGYFDAWGPDDGHNFNSLLWGWNWEGRDDELSVEFYTTKYKWNYSLSVYEEQPMEIHYTKGVGEYGYSMGTIKMVNPKTLREYRSLTPSEDYTREYRTLPGGWFFVMLIKPYMRQYIKRLGFLQRFPVSFSRHNPYYAKSFHVYKWIELDLKDPAKRVGPSQTKTEYVFLRPSFNTACGDFVGGYDKILEAAKPAFDKWRNENGYSDNDYSCVTIGTGASRPNIFMEMDNKYICDFKEEKEEI